MAVTMYMGMAMRTILTKVSTERRNTVRRGSGPSKGTKTVRMDSSTTGGGIHAHG